ncbi:Glycosyl hydrolase family 76 [Geosmithia morbida]|uniref:Glycosyl hydrolase family 76 n=1 Tax=Geosmithia morbida TaxID=1094350 RepID=A0A9P5D9K9_9HYPO|nr:Glycosyl hydrolase family 76 [Geosmithia morbida]KAF4126634.1 Glycosyl hydrolase family 76 [Geosmithia morbida]
MPAFAKWAMPLTSLLATLAKQKDQSNMIDVILTGMTQQEAVQNYTNQAVTGITALNDNWYQQDSGLWAGTWWNSANALTTVVEFAILRPNLAADLNITQLISNTFVKAQQTQLKVRARTTSGPDRGIVEREEQQGSGGERAEDETQGLDKRLFANFLNDFYDDEGWWALALIRSYDLTENNAYLDAAVTIFDDMAGGHGGPCNGGIYWSKDRNYKNAITNELYLSIAASLANRRPQQTRFLAAARKQWVWFQGSGLINEQNLINDGLDDKCRNNGLQTWSYNQGVILGGLAELYRATGNADLLATAKRIATAALDHLTTGKGGVIVETDRCETKVGHCGTDGQQFKGIFVRNLRYLADVAPDMDFRASIIRSADSIWDHDRSLKKFGAAWDGPFNGATAQTQSSALDAIVAAIAIV